MKQGRHQDNDPPKRVVITLPMPAALLDMIDAEVDVERALRPHQYVSRSGVIRQILADVLDHHSRPA